MSTHQHGNGRHPADDERLVARDRERMGAHWDDRSERWDDREGNRAFRSRNYSSPGSTRVAGTGYLGQSGQQMGNGDRDDLPRGPGHRGKGPSGYVRSDERIRENVCEVLMEDDHVDATHIVVSVENGEVMLSGTVEDRGQKRRAEDSIENLPGVKDVVNQLRIGIGNRPVDTQASSDKRHRA